MDAATLRVLAHPTYNGIEEPRHKPFSSRLRKISDIARSEIEMVPLLPKNQDVSPFLQNIRK